MKAIIQPSPLNGTTAAVPSKSEAHRIFICAALADKPTDIIMKETSDDIDATIRCISALGATVEKISNGYRVTPIEKIDSVPVLDCGESGSTLRFLLPVACALYDNVRFTGCGRLPQRPISGLTEALEKHGVTFSSPTLPFETHGLLQGGNFRITGSVSSQYISGVLLALPLIGGRTAVFGKLESSGYVAITQNVMKSFGVETDNCFCEKTQYISPRSISVGGDWSNAAFFLAAGALGRSVTVTGIDLKTAQADNAIAEILYGMGAVVKAGRHSVTASHDTMFGTRLNVCNTPDLLPILAVVAACAEGKSYFSGAQRLRLKESDRLETVSAMLRALGADVSITEDDIMHVTGGTLRGGIVDGANDHRIVMAAAIAATVCENETVITDAQAVRKSYPNFFEDLKALGCKCSLTE